MTVGSGLRERTRCVRLVAFAGGLSTLLPCGVVAKGGPRLGGSANGRLRNALLRSSVLRRCRTLAPRT